MGHSMSHILRDSRSIFAEKINTMIKVNAILHKYLDAEKKTMDAAKHVTAHSIQYLLSQIDRSVEQVSENNKDMFTIAHLFKR